MYGDIMKGFIYKHPMKTGHVTEFEQVHFAFTQAGWKFVELLPETGWPTHMVFEWPKDCPAYYPDVSGI